MTSNCRPLPHRTLALTLALALARTLTLTLTLTLNLKLTLLLALALGLTPALTLTLTLTLPLPLPLSRSPYFYIYLKLALLLYAYADADAAPSPHAEQLLGIALYTPRLVEVGESVCKYASMHTHVNRPISQSVNQSISQSVNHQSISPSPHAAPRQYTNSSYGGLILLLRPHPTVASSRCACPVGASISTASSAASRRASIRIPSTCSSSLAGV